MDVKIDQGSLLF